MDPAYLAPTPIIDSEHPDIVAFAAEAGGEAKDDRERAVNIYYAVRDRIRYNPYSMILTEDHFRASATLARGEGFCITKAALLAAVLRAAGIPSRLGFADVKNHLATQKLIDSMGTDLFAYHGYTDVWLDGRWVKATPAFNLSLCEKFRVLPLEFDGTEDSVFHPFDADGRKHMEYVRDRGVFADVPLREIKDCFEEIYPDLYKSRDNDFAAEAAAENQT
ncbi:MAG: transglutaminase family protein [Alphaproteobacteria bacterium]